MRVVWGEKAGRGRDERHRLDRFSRGPPRRAMLAAAPLPPPAAAIPATQLECESTKVMFPSWQSITVLLAAVALPMTLHGGAPLLVKHDYNYGYVQSPRSWLPGCLAFGSANRCNPIYQMYLGSTCRDGVPSPIPTCRPTHPPKPRMVLARIC